MVTEQPMATLETFAKFVRDYCVATGDFQLSSGARSSVYVDLRRATLNGTMMPVIGALLCEALKTEKIDGIAGMSIGADPLVCATVMIAGQRGRLLHGCFVRPKSKEHGLKNRVEGWANFKKGARFVVVEDTCTTGRSSLEAVEALREVGAEVLGVWTLVDRGGAEVRERFEKQGLWYRALLQFSDLVSDPKGVQK